MTVTEFALFRLRDTYDAVELLELVMECQESQDEWARANHPNSCAKRASVSRMYIDETQRPHQLVITAPWRSPEAHREWLNTAENSGVMAKFAAFLPENSDRSGFLVFHMTPAGRRPAHHLHEAFAPTERLTVTRLAAQGAGGREQLQARFREVEAALAAGSPRDRIWGGWRIKKDHDHDPQEEELVVFRSSTAEGLEPAGQDDELASLRPYGKVIDRELRIAEIAPEPKAPEAAETK